MTRQPFNQSMQSFNIPSEADMLKLGNCWAPHLEAGTVLFFTGELGAGKTTLVRGILLGMGYCGAVTSPTYTLVEHYSLPHGELYHVDLYRLVHPSELEMTGLRDALDGSPILLVEWPERGNGQLPLPNFTVNIRYQGDGRCVKVHSATTESLLPPC